MASPEALVLTSETEPSAERFPFFDAMRAAARKKLGAPAAWEWYIAEALEPTRDILLTGGVPSYPDRKRARWAGVTGQKCVITQADIADACAEYEAVTGHCRECAGSGRRNVGWSRETGRMYRDCERCGATGSAPSSTARLPENSHDASPNA